MRTNEYNIRLVWITLLGLLVACGLVMLTNWVTDEGVPTYGQGAFPTATDR